MQLTLSKLRFRDAVSSRAAYPSAEDSPFRLHSSAAAHGFATECVTPKISGYARLRKAQPSLNYRCAPAAREEFPQLYSVPVLVIMHVHLHNPTCAMLRHFIAPRLPADTLRLRELSRQNPNIATLFGARALSIRRSPRHLEPRVARVLLETHRARLTRL